MPAAGLNIAAGVVNKDIEDEKNPLCNIFLLAYNIIFRGVGDNFCSLFCIQLNAFSLLNGFG